MCPLFNRSQRSSRRWLIRFVLASAVIVFFAASQVPCVFGMVIKKAESRNIPIPKDVAVADKSHKKETLRLWSLIFPEDSESRHFASIRITTRHGDNAERQAIWRNVTQIEGRRGADFCRKFWRINDKKIGQISADQGGWLLYSSIMTQSACGMPKIRGEESESQCSERAKGSFVLLSESANTISTESHSSEFTRQDDENATTLIKLIIIATIFVIVYTIFERIGWLDDECYYGNQQSEPDGRPNPGPQKASKSVVFWLRRWLRHRRD